MTNTDPTPDNVPLEFRERDQWLLWDASADTARRPHWRGNFGVSWSDPDDWHSFDTAIEAARERDSWGIGYVFAFGIDDHDGSYGAIDLDGCLEIDEDGRARPKDWLPSLKPFIERGAYLEVSPSNDGLHIPVQGLELPTWWSNSHFTDEEHEGVEAYEKKFFTVTGNIEPLEKANVTVGDAVVEHGDWVTQWLYETYTKIEGREPQTEVDTLLEERMRSSAGGEWLDKDNVRDALTYIDPDVPYPRWRGIGFGLASFFEEDTAHELFTEWSKKGSEWDDKAPDLAREIIYNEGTDGREVTIATVIYYAKKGGWDPPKPDRVWHQRYNSWLDGLRDDDNRSSPTKDARVNKAANLLEESNEFITPVTKHGRGELYVYRDGVFEPEGERFIKQEITTHALDSLGTNGADQVASAIRSRNPVSRDELDNQLVALENGVLDLDTRTLHEHSPDHLLRSKLPIQYNKNAECMEIDRFLHEITDDEAAVQTLYEWLGYCLTPGYEFHRFLLIHGSGGNGKGVFFDLARAFFGEEDTASVSFNTLTSTSKNVGALKPLDGARINIDGDISSGAITTDQLAKLKQLTGGDTVTVNPKYKDRYQFANSAKMTFATNERPRFHESSDAVARRLLSIEFPQQFTAANDGNPMKRDRRELMDELTTPEELSVLLNEALDGLERLSDRGEFSIEMGTSATERFDDYMTEADPIAKFTSEWVCEESDKMLPKNVVYDLFSEYCREREVRVSQKSVFWREIRNELNFNQARKSLTPSGERIRVVSGLWLTEAASLPDTQRRAIERFYERASVDPTHLNDLPGWERETEVNETTTTRDLPEWGEDFEVEEAQISTYTRHKEAKEAIVDELASEPLSREELISRATDREIPKNSVTQTLESMKRRGDVMTMDGDRYELT